MFRCLVQQSMWGNMGVVICNALLKNGILHVRAFILKQYKHLHYTEKKEAKSFLKKFLQLCLIA